jgi:hypothetical protein
VYCAFYLYNAAEEDFEAAEEGMQLGLLRGQDWVGPGEVSAGGQPFPDPENGVIRFVGWIDTEKLPPGRYTVVAVLPNHRDRQMPELSGEFEVLPRETPSPGDDRSSPPKTGSSRAKTRSP